MTDCVMAEQDRALTDSIVAVTNNMESCPAHCNVAACDERTEPHQTDRLVAATNKTES